MFQPLSLAIGLRYLRAKRRNGRLSFVSLASILGIIIGMVALITTISVMSGFQHELRERILGMVAHATVSGFEGRLQDWSHAVQAASADPRIAGAAPYVEREAMLRGGRIQGALMRGVLPEHEPRVSVVAQRMLEGSLDELRPGGFGIVLGRELALSLGVGVGDRVQLTTYLTEGGSSPVGQLPRSRAFTVVGVFEVGAQEYDLGLALVHLQDAQRLLRLGDDVTGVRLRLVDMWQAFPVARDLDRQLGGGYRVRDWAQDHQNFFRALKMEKTVMFVLLSLVIAIAAFNLVSSLVMLVQDKQSDIAILRTMGMLPGAIARVFMMQGIVIGAVGISIGTCMGVLLSLNLNKVVAAIEAMTGSELMPAEVYYISGVPTVVDPADVALVVAIAFVLCLLATIYPALRAARTEPAAALRYE
jgi:lipoprotein-releasing system permease protein